MIRDYEKKVNFVYVYKALAHPETNGFVQPVTLEERLKHVAIADKKLGTHAKWICDSIENDIKHAFGDRPNSEFVMDANGKVLIARSWSNPTQLREDLVKLVGKIEKPTRVSDLKLNTNYSATNVKTGAVKRLEMPSAMSPLKTSVDSENKDKPLYAKLRAEADSDLLRNGKGKLYLGFFIDPVHQVHWNNEAPPLRFSIESGNSVKVSPEKGESKKVEVKADADPREFLLDVNAFENEPIKVTVNYFACDDNDTFCVPVKQVWTIEFKRDADGGSRRSAGQRGGRGRPGAGSRPQGGMAGRIREMDKNQDGKIQRSEAIGRMRQMFNRIDRNEDGVLDGEEIQRMMRRR